MARDLYLIKNVGQERLVRKGHGIDEIIKEVD